jgi:hypothetical protein
LPKLRDIHYGSTHFPQVKFIDSDWMEFDLPVWVTPQILQPKSCLISFDKGPRFFTLLVLLTSFFFYPALVFNLKNFKSDVCPTIERWFDSSIRISTQVSLSL